MAFSHSQGHTAWVKTGSSPARLRQSRRRSSRPNVSAGRDRPESDRELVSQGQHHQRGHQRQKHDRLVFIHQPHDASCGCAFSPHYHNAESGHYGRMSNEAPLMVYFSCPNCEAVYSAIQEQRPGRHPGGFQCRKCGTLADSWTGLYNFTNWEPLIAGRKRRSCRWIGLSKRACGPSNTNPRFQHRGLFASAREPGWHLLQRAFYLFPVNPEQSGDVIASPIQLIQGRGLRSALLLSTDIVSTVRHVR